MDHNPFANLDTTPGSGAWCAPAEPVDDYRRWLRRRFREDVAVRQYMGVAARWLRRDGDEALEVGGPHAGEFLDAVRRLAGS